MNKICPSSSCNPYSTDSDGDDLDDALDPAPAEFDPFSRAHWTLWDDATQFADGSAPGVVFETTVWINRRSELVGATGTQTHPYDYAYSYDSIGNRLTSSDDFGTATYSANCLNQYTAINRTIEQSEQSNNPVYDADGNLTQDDRFNYAYDDENRLVSVTPTNPICGSRAIENAYDHRNRRIRKVVKSYDGSSWNFAETSLFVWDGWNIVLEQITFSDSTTRTIEYYWGNDLSGTEQGAGGVGGLLAMAVDGVFYIPVYDNNGNIVMYVDAGNGTIAAQYTYDPYGNIVQSSGSLAVQFSFGFSSKYHDREVGLIPYQLRVYSPLHGRWLNRDPIGEDGGENLYGICGNDVVSSIDFLGCARMLTNVLYREAMIERDPQIKPHGDDGGIPIQEYGNVNMQNVFGCYLSPGVRKCRDFSEKKRLVYYSVNDQYERMLPALYAKLLKYKNRLGDGRNGQCKVRIRIYEGEIINQVEDATA